VLSVTVRKINESTGKQFTGEPVEVLRQALEHSLEPGVEYNIESSDVEQLAFLDDDFHAAPPGQRPGDKLLNVGCCTAPAPAAYWISHGGGLKRAYVAAGNFTADELAAVALYDSRRHLASLYGYSGSEIAPRTRHPRSVRNGRTCEGLCGVNGYCGTGVDRACREVMAEYPTADEEVIDEWLAEHGWEIGRRYPHDRCPIDPCECSRNDPVVCLGTCIYCHRCAGVLGDGFRSYHRLIASDGGEVERPENVVKAMVWAKCHWTHAKHVLVPMFGHQAKLLYRALLKACHLHNVPKLPDGTANPERVAKETLIGWATSERVKIVRTVSGWFDADLKTPVKDSALTRFLTGLPTVWYYHVDEKGKGKLRMDPVREAECIGDAKISGYPPILPVHGVDLARHAKLIGSGTGTVRVEVPADRHPFRYVEPHERGDYEQHFATYFPGVNLDVVRLGIGALAFAQTNAGEVPMIFITGQSGAAKTRHAELAAVACGVEPAVLKYSNKGTERLDQQYGTAAERGGIAIMDEFGKHAGKGRKNELDGSDVVATLNGFRRGMSYHRLYVGPVSLTYAPPLMMTDTGLPPYFRDEVQIARRVVHVALGAGILAGGYDWRQTSRQNGASGILDWRDASPDNARACDCLVSDVIDHLRAGGYGGAFQGFAAMLGFHTVQNGTGDGVDAEEVYRELFQAVCRLARQTDNESGDKSFKGRGWVVFDPNNETAVVKAYAAAIGYESVYTSDGAFDKQKQRLGGVQWGRVLGVPGVELDLDKHGKKIALRFRLGVVRGFGRDKTRFNYEIPVAADGGNVAAPVAAAKVA
jgi:hypothetical protein